MAEKLAFTESTLGVTPLRRERNGSKSKPSLVPRRLEYECIGYFSTPNLRENSMRQAFPTIARWATTKPLVIGPVPLRRSDHLEQSACLNCLCTSWIRLSSTRPT